MVTNNTSAPSLVGDGYIDLKTALPLKMPISVIIEPTNQCNFRCTFCPTGDKELLNKVGRPKGLMSLSFFQKIIDDISKMSIDKGQNLKSLLLYKDGEPLLNKDLHNMISYAKKKKVTQFIGVTTNGALLNKDTSKNLLESELDDLRISITAPSNEKYKSITKTNYNMDEIKNNIDIFYDTKKKKKGKTRVTVQIVDTGMSPEEKKNFISTFKNISDRIFIKPIMGWSDSDVKDWRLGNKRKTIHEPVVCDDPFSKLSVNFNGSVSVCCVDWSYNTLVGDLNNESFQQVWEGEKLKKFRIIHLKGRRCDLKACKNCDAIREKKDTYGNIDSIRESLLEVYK